MPEHSLPVSRWLKVTSIAKRQRRAAHWPGRNTMAWETRGGPGHYYTRSTRVEGRVLRQYVGTGDVGEATASADHERRAARDAEREARRSTISRLAEMDRQVAVLCEAAETATRASLLLGGYQRHDRGHWRLKRD